MAAVGSPGVTVTIGSSLPGGNRFRTWLILVMIWATAALGS